MPGYIPRGKRIGAVSMWLLLLLWARPTYGYEIIRELEKRFSGFWKPTTGTIYPALEKLEKEGLLTSRVEFQKNDLENLEKQYPVYDALYAFCKKNLVWI